MTKVLGVYIGHDPAACLLEDGKIRAFIEEERLTRFKHGRPDALGRLWPRFAGRAGYFPWAAVNYCLRAARLSLDELDAMVLPGEWCGEGVVAAIPMRDPGRILFATEPAAGAHHFRHALSTYFASAFDDAAVLVVDDDGSVSGGQYEAESGYVFRGRGGHHEL
ncbi:MAG TPA: carbamoyltransferase N-terminal domain-containing protein, partial [Polyangiales bacterium]|nr:carbamoyltransferase N-terminal domain-containing protein [Polyangiales bacterium]